MTTSLVFSDCEIFFYDGLDCFESDFSTSFESACRDYWRTYVHRTDEKSKKQGRENLPAEIP